MPFMSRFGRMLSHLREIHIITKTLRIVVSLKQHILVLKNSPHWQLRFQLNRSPSMSGKIDLIDMQFIILGSSETISKFARLSSINLGMLDIHVHFSKDLSLMYCIFIRFFPAPKKTILPKGYPPTLKNFLKPRMR